MAPAVVATLHEAFRAALHDPAHVAELAMYDQEPDYLGPADYGRSLREVAEVSAFGFVELERVGDRVQT